MTLRVGGFNKNVDADDPLADEVTITCPASGNQPARTFVAKRPYFVRYNSITATPSATPTTGTSQLFTGLTDVGSTASWAVPAGVTAGQLEFSGRTKTCPASYNCNSGNWGNAHSYATTCPATLTGD